MKRYLSSVWIFVSFLAALLLIASQLSIYVNPASLWIFGLWGLAYPLFLFANWVLLIIGIFRWKWPLFIPLVAIVVGYGVFSNIFQFPFGKKGCDWEHTTKVLSYNVHLFHQVPWREQDPTYHAISDFIGDENPDIFCIQEFYTSKGQLSEQHFRDRHSQYAGHIHYIVKRKGSAYGLATFSKYPIINQECIPFEGSANACIFTDVVVSSDTVRVYNVHFQSLRLKERNLRFLSDQEYRKESQKMDEIKDISIRFRDAVVKRSEQVAMVSKSIENCKYHVIVCGDFNESPVSFNYRQMRKNLGDAFVDAGKGTGYTFRGLLPALRIDYILYSNFYQACQYITPHIEHSDHYPVIATLTSHKEPGHFNIRPKVACLLKLFH